MDIKQLEKGKIRLRDKGKVKSRYNRFMLIIVLFFIGGYTLFFTSNIWYDDMGDLVDATSISTVKNWEDREVELLAWDYSAEQDMMEIQLEIENLAYDGIDDYEVTSVEKDKGYLNTELVINENGFYVIRITNVPEKWKQISLRINLPENDEDTCKLYTNKLEVSTVENIQDKTINEYMLERLSSLITSYNDSISELEKDIETQNTIIENANKDIDEYKQEEEFQTPIQKEETDSLISNAQSTISTANAQIEQDNENIEEYKERITLTEKQMQNYQED